jgi:hypothetical protein
MKQIWRGKKSVWSKIQTCMKEVCNLLHSSCLRDQNKWRNKHSWKLCEKGKTLPCQFYEDLGREQSCSSSHSKPPLEQSVAKITFRPPFLPGMKPINSCRLNRRSCGPDIQSVRFGKEKHLPLPEFKLRIVRKQSFHDFCFNDISYCLETNERTII